MRWLTSCQRRRSYWVIDLKPGVVHVMSDPQADEYAMRRVVAFGTPLAVPGTDATIVLP